MTADEPSSGGWSEATKAYKANPTIENYVKLRRENPDVEIEVAISGGMEALFAMEKEFRKYGLEPELVAGVMDADTDSISKVCLHLLEKIIAAQSLNETGETHLASRGKTVPNKFIDWIIACSLDALSWNDNLQIPRDLIVLIRERLGGPNREYDQMIEVYEMKRNAGLVAGQLKAQGVNPTFRILGEIFKVAPSTVKRWFEPGELEKEIDVWAKHFDKDGKMIPISDWVSKNQK
jgi:hypothetical protein